jgi:hypothetical protein
MRPSAATGPRPRPGGQARREQEIVVGSLAPRLVGVVGRRDVYLHPILFTKVAARLLRNGADRWGAGYKAINLSKAVSAV